MPISLAIVSYVVNYALISLHNTVCFTYVLLLLQRLYALLLAWHHPPDPIGPSVLNSVFSLDLPHSQSIRVALNTYYLYHLIVRITHTYLYCFMPYALFLCYGCP